MRADPFGFRGYGFGVNETRPQSFNDWLEPEDEGGGPFSYGG